MDSELDPITVVLASDSCPLGDGLAAFLDDVPDVTLTGRTDRLDGLLDLVDELDPQFVVVGIRSPVVTAGATIAAAHQLRQHRPEVGVVVISDRAQEFAVELLRRGSAGIAYLLDGTLPGFATVIGTLRKLRLGRQALGSDIAGPVVPPADPLGLEGLSPRETDILEQMAHGRSNRAIADQLHMSVKSIEKGITGIFSKLGPFDRGIEDRRVSASLAFLRTQTDPFGPVPGPREGTPPSGPR